MDDTAQNNPPSSPILSDALPPEPPVTPSAPTPPLEETPVSMPPSSMPPPPPPPPPPQPPSFGEVVLPQMPTGGDMPSEGSHKKTFMIVGIALLFVVFLLGGLFLFSQRSQPTPVATQPAATPKPVVAAFTLAVTQPQEGSLLTTGEVVVSGTATPGAIVVVITEVDQNSVITDTTGSFSTAIKLVSGINDISITAVDSTGAQKKEMRQVLYDNE